MLGLLLTGSYAVLNSTAKSVSNNLLQENAIEVARRHMEMLIVTKKEPDSLGLETIDEIDENYTWQLDLEREPVGQKAATLENTIIHATVTVRLSDSESAMTPVELHRFFSTLDPKDGNIVAVPLKTAYEYDDTYQSLKKLLGREPTPMEMLEYQFRYEEQ